MTNRGGILLAAGLCAAGCVRLRSANPDFWLELQSEHFLLRTDLPEESARKAVADLELIRNALLAAGWPARTASPGRIGVIALAGPAEMHEFLSKTVAGITTHDSFGDRFIFVDGS